MSTIVKNYSFFYLYLMFSKLWRECFVIWSKWEYSYTCEDIAIRGVQERLSSKLIPPPFRILEPVCPPDSHAPVSEKRPDIWVCEFLWKFGWCDDEDPPLIANHPLVSERQLELLWCTGEGRASRAGGGVGAWYLVSFRCFCANFRNRRRSVSVTNSPWTSA